jgi:quinol monooxygenase YgiN
VSGAPPVTVIIAYEALPGMVDTARSELSALIEIVVAREPDCLGIRMFADVTAPGRLLLIELWTSAEAFTGPHMETPHLRSFRERAGGFIAGPPEVRFWSEIAAALPASGRLDA